MRLRMVRLADGTASVAVAVQERWVPLAALPGAERLGAGARDLLALLAGGPASRERVGTLVATGEHGGSGDALALPFVPTGLRDCSLWEQHHIGAARGLLALHAATGRAGRAAAGLAAAYERVTARPFPPLRPPALWYAQPVYYKGSPGGWIGDGDTAPWPWYTQALDYELEIGLVVGTEVRDAEPAAALDAVGGFVLLDDLSARDVQLGEMQARMGPAKCKDFATAVGPVVVTPEEMLPLFGDLRGEVRVNGVLVATGSTAQMRHSIADVVAHASAGERLRPGEVIGLGTLPGCSALENGAWVRPGDVVELRAGPLGALRTVIGEPEPTPRRSGPLRRARWTVVPRPGDDRDPPGPRPARWRPPPAMPLTGRLAPNAVLDDVARLELPGGCKPEDVVLDGAGRLYSGAEDGRIYRWPADPTPGSVPELFTDTHGRPLGLEIDPRDGSLLVCDAYRGLLTVDGAGQVRVLADAWQGRALRFVNNAAVAADGTVYFSDSSIRFPIEHYKVDLLEHRPNGRVFRYRPGTGELTLLADGLYFPNGVALSPDESALVVAETGTYRLLRIPLTGPAAGAAVVLADLPGFPDNVSAVGDGTYWVAVASLRLPALDRTMPRPALRRVAAALPARWQPAAGRYGLVVQVDGAGRVLRSLHGPAGRYAEITGVRQHGPVLYLGSLAETAVGQVRLPPA